MSHFFRVFARTWLIRDCVASISIWVTLLLTDKYTSNDCRDWSVKCLLPDLVCCRQKQTTEYPIRLHRNKNGRFTTDQNTNMTSKQVQDRKYINCTAALYRGNSEPRPRVGDQGQWILSVHSNSLPIEHYSRLRLSRDVRIIMNSDFTKFLKNCALFFFFTNKSRSLLYKLE